MRLAASNPYSSAAHRMSAPASSSSRARCLTAAGSALPMLAPRRIALSVLSSSGPWLAGVTPPRGFHRKAVLGQLPAWGPALEERLDALAGVGLPAGPPEQDALTLESSLAIGLLEELPSHVLGDSSRCWCNVRSDVPGQFCCRGQHAITGYGSRHQADLSGLRAAKDAPGEQQIHGTRITDEARQVPQQVGVGDDSSPVEHETELGVHG